VVRGDNDSLRAAVRAPRQPAAVPQRSVEASVHLTSNLPLMAERVFQYLALPQTVTAEVVVGTQRQDAWRNINTTARNQELFSDANNTRAGVDASMAWNPCGLYSAALDDARPLWGSAPEGAFGAVSYPAGADGSFEAPLAVTLASHNRDPYTCGGVRLRFSGAPGNAAWASRVTAEWFAGGERLGRITAHPNRPDFVCRAAMKRFDEVTLTFERSAVPENRLSLELAELWGVQSPALKPGDVISLPLSDGGPCAEGRIETVRFKLREGSFRAEVVAR
jgi:hypothetical protein